MKDLSLYIVTWNICGQQPSENLSTLLNLPEEDTSNDVLPDIYSIHLQEVNSQPQNMVLDFLFDDPWTQAFSNALKKFDYIRLKVERLQGIVLMLFMKRKLLTHVTGLETALTRVGLGGMWGNKGGTTIRLNIHGCSICIVNSHLSAHLEEIEKRINEYSVILDGQEFKDPQTNRIITHDYVFWAGDLNFRIDGLKSHEVDALARSRKFPELLAKDQLRQTMKSGQAFSEFKESDPEFPPSYKYIIGTDEYELSRVPSWTDRIMYRLTPNAYDGVTLETNQLDYKCHSTYKKSDHKPISSCFNIKVFKKNTDDLVQFYGIDNWLTNVDNQALYKISEEYKPSNYDWIGLYKVDFMSINEHLCYVWVNVKPITNREPTSPQDKSSQDDSQATCKLFGGKMLPVYRVVITDQSVILPGSYRLVYISNKFSNVLGISDPFEVESRN